MNQKINDQGFPVLPIEKQARPYQPAGAKPGHDGQRPHIVELTDRKADDGSASVVERNVKHCPLDWLLQCKHIEPLQHAAGRQLYADHYLAGLDTIPSVMASLNARGFSCGSTEEMLERKIMAARRLEKALMSVGTRGRFLLQEIAIRQRWPKDVAPLLRVHTKAVVPSLVVALDHLVSHYGLLVTGPKGADMRSWAHPFHAEV